MSLWPFCDWLRLAVHVFGLSPEQFWDMSVYDFMRLISSQSPRLNRDELSELMKLYPDGEICDGA